MYFLYNYNIVIINCQIVKKINAASKTVKSLLKSAYMTTGISSVFTPLRKPDNLYTLIVPEMLVLIEVELYLDTV